MYQSLLVADLTSSYKKDVLKKFRKKYSQKNTNVGVSFLIKMRACRPATLWLKRNSDTGVFLRIFQIFKNTYFEEYKWTAVWTFSYMYK